MNKVPKLRFPEFEGEWEEKKLGEIFDFYTTNSYSRDSLNYIDGEVKNIHYGDIHTKFPTILDCSKNVLPYINPDIDLSRISEESYCKEGDIVIADASEDYNDIGKTIELKNIGEAKIVAGLHTLLGRDNKGITTNGYRGYMMSTNSIHHQVRILAVGSKVLGISKSNIVKVIANIPNRKEQEKIASFFSLIDKKIEKQQKKVNAIQEYKKGMMQKIFSQEIRFKDQNGEDYPEWEEKGFGEFLTSRVLKQVPSQEAPLMAFTATGGIEPKGDRYDRSFLVKSDEKLYKRTELNDFIYSSNNLDVGSIGLNKYGTAVISDVYEIFVINKDVSYNFISEFIKTPKVMSKIISYRQGVMYGQYRIHAEDFLKIKEFIPCLEEQQKIAKFLTELDIKIEKEQEKLQQLQQWKKGLLQQMFV